MKKHPWLAHCVAASALVVLAACGGNNDGYGAIAISDSGRAAAIASDAITQSVANETARDKCDAADCNVVLQFRDCGAVASGSNSTGARVFGTAEAGSEFDAQTAANNACTAKGGAQCGPVPNLGAQCN